MSKTISLTLLLSSSFVLATTTQPSTLLPNTQQSVQFEDEYPEPVSFRQELAKRGPWWMDLPEATRDSHIKNYRNGGQTCNGNLLKIGRPGDELRKHFYGLEKVEGKIGEKRAQINLPEQLDSNAKFF